MSTIDGGDDVLQHDVGRSAHDDTEWWYDGDYDALVRHGADLVETGGAPLHDLTLPDWEDYADEETEATAEMIGGNVPPEKIQADVKQLLDEGGLTVDTDEEPKPNQGGQLDWDALWDDFDIPREPQSHTQLGLLVEASPRTSITEHGSDAVDDAIAAGRIVQIREGEYVPGAWR